VLLGTSLGTPWEHDGNTLGTRGKKKKPPKISLPTPHLKRKKTGPLMNAC